MSSVGARRRALCGLLERGKAAEQAGLVKELAAAGYPVSQSTVSRDLRYLGAAKDSQGRYRLVGYPEPRSGSQDIGVRLGRAINSYAVSIEASANLVVLKTFPGAASVVASALDAALDTGEIGEVLGTVAGDDTVLVVTARTSGGHNVKQQLELIGETA